MITASITTQQIQVNPDNGKQGTAKEEEVRGRQGASKKSWKWGKETYGRGQEKEGKKGRM